MRVFLGADPGAQGYICALAPDIQRAEFISNSDKPHLIVEKLRELHDEYSVTRVCIEEVHSIPGSGAKQNFNFGFNVGLLHGIFLSLAFGIDFIKPKAWQKHIGLNMPPIPKDLSAKEQASFSRLRKKQLKESVGKVAERLYPDISVRGPRGGLLDGKSDSLMIAHYAYHLHR